MVTKQDLFRAKVKELGGEADTLKMMEVMDEDRVNIWSISHHLERRRLLKIVKDKIPGGVPHFRNRYIYIERKKKWQPSQE